MDNHKQTFKNSPIAFNMIHIEGGTFDMGSDGEEAYDDEKPVHAVMLSDYWLCEVPVTQELWAFVMQDTDIANPSYFKGTDRPVEKVSWDDIVHQFLPKLNAMTDERSFRHDALSHGLRPAGTEYRLPTEAQWEYAAKGGKYWNEYNFDFSGSEKLNEVAWYDENSYEETKSVGLKTPNLLGLHDMNGNVWEWCGDCYDDNFYKKCKQEGVVEDPCNHIEGSYRVHRGGSYFNFTQLCRLAFRSYNTPSYSYDNIGFRLALVFSSV